MAAFNKEKQMIAAFQPRRHEVSEAVNVPGEILATHFPDSFIVPFWV
jgi:hypothetical protein